MVRAYLLALAKRKARTTGSSNIGATLQNTKDLASVGTQFIKGIVAGVGPLLQKTLKGGLSGLKTGSKSGLLKALTLALKEATKGTAIGASEGFGNIARDDMKL